MGSTAKKPVVRVGHAQGKAAEAFAYWQNHSYESLVTVAAKFKVAPETMRRYISVNKLSRPDGKDKAVLSPRQVWIEKGYNKAVKEKWDAGKAATWVEQQGKVSCARGDLQYWAMKRNLPLLPEGRGSNMPVMPAPPPIPKIL